MTISIELSNDGMGAELKLPAGNTIKIPLDHRAGPLIEKLLYAQNAQSSKAKGLGTAAAPLQSMVDDYLYRGGVIHRIEPVQKGKPSGRIDISLDELFPELS